MSKAVLGSPKAASTPKANIKFPRGRPGIRSRDRESIQSPIYDGTTLPSNLHDDDSDAEAEGYESDSWHACDTHPEEQLRIPESTGYNLTNRTVTSTRTRKTSIKNIPSSTSSSFKKEELFGRFQFMVAFLIVSATAALCVYYTTETSDISKANLILRNLSEQFSFQSKDFWLTIEVALKDIQDYNKPKAIIFLYTDKSIKNLQKIREGVSNLAVCAISSCSSTPIVLTPSELNAVGNHEDYGRIIANFREKLKSSGVMVVENFDKLSGKVAQAFHSFCDEYNPVVHKALFLFTVRVPAYPKNKVKYLEDHLRIQWSDLPDDLFYPLYTRISETILAIHN